jgi:phage terminase large subunit
LEQKIELNLPDIVGRGYGTFWNYKGRYRVVKGSRASKKSKTMALWLIWAIMNYSDANALVVRKTFRTIKDSSWTDLKWACNRLNVTSNWTFTVSPLEATYKKTGQKILFRGMDDPLKLTSITVEKGNLCWLWIEEAYEISTESDFDTLDESIRGKLESGSKLFKQVTLTFNPWNEKHWMKKRFFDNQSPDVLAMTTNYMCNEWLDESDEQLFAEMKKNNPKRYNVAGLGNWGIVDGLVYENWKEQNFDLEEIKKIKGIKSVFGLDFGYTNDPTALFCGMVDLDNRKMYVFDELYKTGLSNRAIYEEIKNLGYAKEHITADSAEPKSIDELEYLGLRHIKGAKKGKDSIANGIQWIQDFEIIVHPRCANFLTEIGNYSWSKDKFGKKLNVPIDDFNHLMDAMRYACEKFVVGDKWMF